MACAPNGDGILDIRSAGLLYDVTAKFDDCAPGALAAAQKEPFVRESYHHKRRRDDHGHRGHTHHRRKKPKYDRNRNWIGCFAACFIVMGVIGIINGYIVLVPYVRQVYDMEFFQGMMTGVVSMALTVLLCPPAAMACSFMGFRATASFGLCLMLIGFLLDILEINHVILWITRCVFLPIGGALAYTAALSSVANQFEKGMLVSLILVSSSGLIGIALYVPSVSYLALHLGYAVTQLSFALLILVMATATAILPSGAPSDMSSQKEQRERVKECMRKVKEEKRRKEQYQREHEEHSRNEELRTCLCMCSYSTIITGDKSSALWTLLTMLATMTFHFPYIHLLLYILDAGMEADPWFIINYCIASIAGRLIILVSHDLTFSYNRWVFQIGCIGSGILYLVLLEADTRGWMFIWIYAQGVIQGLLGAVIPRVTLVTIPKAWLASSWAIIVVVDSIGIFAISTMLLLVRAEFEVYSYPAFVGIGVAQILAGILAFLIPDAYARPDSSEEGSKGETLGSTKTKDPHRDLHPKEFGNLNSDTFGFTYYSRFPSSYCPPPPIRLPPIHSYSYPLTTTFPNYISRCP